MYSEFIQAKVLERFGKPVKCIEDCKHLVLNILACTSFRISETSLVNLFGINSQLNEPKLYALGVLAIYLGYDSNAQMRADFNSQKFNALDVLIVNECSPYTSICVTDSYHQTAVPL